MFVKKCERCGKVYNNNPSSKSNGIRFIDHYLSNNGQEFVSNQKYFDLCPDCMHKLEQFLDDVLLGEPARQKVEHAYNALLQDVPDVDAATGYLGEVLEG